MVQYSQSASHRSDLTTTLGIDPSLSSTGLCVVCRTEPIRLTLLSPHFTKNQRLLAQKHNIELIETEYSHLKDAACASRKELLKTRNILSILNKFKSWLPEKETLSAIGIEAVAFNACGTIDSLAGLNYLLRIAALEVCADLRILSPTSIKKQSVGNGNAQKQDMIEAFLRTTGLSQELLDLKGISDLADAYWIARCIEKEQNE